MRSRLSAVSAPLALIIGVVLTFLLVAVSGWATVSVFGGKRAASAMERSYWAILEATKLELLMREAEAYQREYILSADEISLARFHETLSSLPSAFEEFRSAAATDENRLDRTHSVRQLLEQRISELLRSAEQRARGGLSAALEAGEAAQGRQVMEGLHFNLSWILHEEEHRLRALRAAKEKKNRHAVTGTLLAIGLALAVLPCFIQLRLQLWRRPI